MKRILIGTTICLAAALTAADPPGLVQWSAAELKDYGRKLAPKMNAQKMGTEQLGRFGRHSLMMAYREASGEAELHATVADIFIVQAGEATLVAGGKIIGGKTTAPGEVRGASIEGGVKKKIAAGDVIHIPENLPHQVVLGPGARFTYAIVKVEK